VRHLFGRIHIASEVYHEVVMQGAGRAAATAVRAADWIETHPPADPVAIGELRSQNAIGAGELATLLLARGLKASLALIDERIARRLAQARGMSVMGCIGILETGHHKGLVPDLRGTYVKILERGGYIDRQLLNRSLNALQLPPL
jgi:predicted nucleic acid-binding protein